MVQKPSFIHINGIARDKEPSLRYKDSESFSGWQKQSRMLLERILGLDKLTKPEFDSFNVEFETEHEDFKEIRFTFKSEENFTVPCHILLPKNVPAPYVPVICIQGHSKGMHISLGRARYEGDEESINSGDRDFARRAVKEGCAAITMEQRYMGELGGTEYGPDCFSAALAALLYGRTAIGERVWDLTRLTDVLTDHFDCLDMSRLVTLGNSGGGTTLFYHACLDKRVYCAVPSCSVCTYKDSIAAMEHCCCNYLPRIAEYFDMGDLGGLIAPRCLVVVNGKDDPIFPKSGVDEAMAQIKRLYSAAKVPDNVINVTGDGEHRFYADIAWKEIHRFLKPRADLIIFAGQSNMQGQSETVLPDGAMRGCYEYKMLSDEIVPLATPVGENVRKDGSEGEQITEETDLGKWLDEHALGAACYGNTNLVPAFCKKYVNESNRYVIAVHAAKGSTMVSDWLPGTEEYDALIRKSIAAVKKAREGYEVENVYAVWLQGESDAIFAPDKKAYKEKLSCLAGELFEKVGVDKFGIIRVGRFTRDERDDEIIEAQNEICREDERFLMLTEIATELNENPEYMHPTIGGHFSAKGLQKLGAAAAEALAAYKIAQK